MQLSVADCRLAAEDERWSKAEQALVTQVDDRIGELCGQPPHSEEAPLLPLSIAAQDHASFDDFHRILFWSLIHFRVHFELTRASLHMVIAAFEWGRRWICHRLLRHRGTNQIQLSES
jgi:hypothetical protein